MPSYEPPAPFVTEASPAPVTRPTSHSFSLHRPNIDAKKTRNAKRLSLVVPPSPGVLENLAAISTPSFPPLSISRRPFTPARMPTITSSTASEVPATPTTVVDATTKRHSQFLLDNALPTSCFPVANAAKARRPISAYFSDFSVECGTASPYTSEPVCVLPHLYLGAEHNASDSVTLSRLGISHVLNVAVEIAQQCQEGTRVEKNGIRYHHLSWTHHQKNLSSEFPEAFDHIEQARSTGGKILVHCQLGVSRSASLVIAYVMKAENKSLTEAYDFVKDRSGVISPNMSLMYQLAEFEKSLRGSGSGSGGASGKRDNRIFDQEEPYHGGFPSEEDMDVDGDHSPRPSPQAPSSKRNSLVLSLGPGSGSSSQEQKPFKPMRPRSTYRHTLLGAEAAASVAASVPKTPLTDRFSFDRTALAYPPLSALNNSGNGSSRLTPVEASPTTPSFVSDFASMGSAPSSASCSMSSRPSSTSSAATFSTSTDYFYPKGMNQGNGVSTLPTIPPSPTVSRRSSNGTADRDSMLLSRRSGSWGPHAPLPEVPPSPWMNTSHGSQRKRQSFQAPLEGRVDDVEDKAISSVGSTATTSLPGATTTTGTGTGTPEFIFSPRPCSPPLLETRNFGDFYQALRMEG
ncbi:Dual specificity protein phosphatase 10 [Podila minutissima]|uniref:protein-tyrosine-phosphatase n=1 Tax=Podila minutissima TaxID=64525 RepID=A0A9P5VHK1_9FUNG|nr:Dual specificity protein phosphatase 10 [Podila minutissima]